MQGTSQMEAPVYNDYSTGSESSRITTGIPPSHPNNPQVMFASRPHLNPNANMRPTSSSHYRSLPPSSVFDALPSWTQMSMLTFNDNTNNYHYYHHETPSPFVVVNQSLTNNVVSSSVEGGAGSYVANQSLTNNVVSSSVEGTAGNYSHGFLSATPPPPPSPPVVVGGGGCENLPPRKGHRRCFSDSPLRYSAMLASSPQLVPIGMSSRGESSSVSQSVNVEGFFMGEGMSEDEIVEDLMSEYMRMEYVDVFDCGSVSKVNGGGESSDNEVESGGILNGGGSSERREGVNKRSAAEDISLTAGGHYRSVSIDSCLELLDFDFDDDDVAKVPVQAGGQVVEQVSPGGVVGERLAMLRMKLNGELSEDELRKIAVNDKLTQIAFVDPRRAKRILANRQSAARSKERKVQYIAELEQKVKTLMAETNTLNTKYATLQKDSEGVLKINKEMKFRLEAMDQEVKLKDALNESLNAELERMKLEMNGMARLSRLLAQQLSLNNQILQNQHPHLVLPNIYQLQQQQQDLLPNQFQQPLLDPQPNLFQLQQQNPQPYQLQLQQQNPQPNQLQPELQNGEAAIAE